MKKHETTKESLNKAQSNSAQVPGSQKVSGAMRDHKSEQQAIRDKMERFRALRKKVDDKS